MSINNNVKEKQIFISCKCSLSLVSFRYGVKQLKNIIDKLSIDELTIITDEYINELIMNNNMIDVSLFDYYFISQNTCEKLIELLYKYEYKGYIANVIYPSERDESSRLINHLFYKKTRDSNTMSIIEGKYGHKKCLGFIPMLYYRKYQESFSKMMDFFINVYCKKYGIFIKKTVEEIIEFDEYYKIGYSKLIRDAYYKNENQDYVCGVYNYYKKRKKMDEYLLSLDIVKKYNLIPFNFYDNSPTVSLVYLRSNPKNLKNIQLIYNTNDDLCIVEDYNKANSKKEFKSIEDAVNYFKKQIENA